MNTIIMRAYYEKLPYSMIESAKIDGASEYQIFWRMMFPLAKPALATICLTLFVAYWNAYYEAMMYMDTGNYVTIQLLLQRMLEKVDFLKNNASTGWLGSRSRKASRRGHAYGNVRADSRADAAGVPSLPKIFRQGYGNRDLSKNKIIDRTV